MSDTSHDILDLLPEPHRTLAKQRRADAAREAQTPNSDIPRLRRGEAMKKHGMHRLRGPDGPTDIMDHFESVPGQRTPTLCGWDGGHFVRFDPDIQAPLCPECAAIMAWAKKVKP